MKKLNRILKKTIALKFTLLALFLVSCEQNELIIEQQELNQIGPQKEVLENTASKCTNSSGAELTGYDWLNRSPNNRPDWKLQYLAIEAKRTGSNNGNPNFYEVDTSRFEVVGTNCSRLRFRTYHDDPATGNSSYPRTEIREQTKFNANGQEKAAGWDHEITRWLEIEFKVREMPYGGRIAVAQIHSGKDDIALIVVYRNQNGDYKVTYKVESDSGSVEHTIYDYTVANTFFKLRLKMENDFVKARKVTDTAYLPAVLIKNDTVKYRTKTCYFKAGIYYISNEPGQARVEFYKIKTSGAQEYHESGY